MLHSSYTLIWLINLFSRWDTVRIILWWLHIDHERCDQTQTCICNFYLKRVYKMYDFLECSSKWCYVFLSVTEECGGIHAYITIILVSLSKLFQSHPYSMIYIYAYYEDPKFKFIANCATFMHIYIFGVLFRRIILNLLI